MPLERLEEELYKTESQEIKKRGASRPKTFKSSAEPETFPSWQEEPEPQKERYADEKVAKRISSVRRWLLGSAVGVSIILVGIAAFYFYLGLTAQGVMLEVQGGEEVLLGVPFTIGINYSNNSRSILRDARIALTLPQGVILLGEDEAQRIVSRTLGDVGVGSQGKEELQLLALENPQSVKRVEVSLDYVASQLGSRFERTASKSLVVGEEAIRIGFSAPEKVLSGEEFEVKVNYENISSFNFSDLELRLEYPPLFRFGKSSIPSSQGNFLWQVGELRSGSSGELVIKGSAIGKAESFFEIPLALHVIINGRKYALEQKSVRVGISPSPLSLEITANGKTEYVAGTGEQLEYAIHYMNNTDVNLRDVVLQVKLVGEMFEIASVSSDGFLNSLNNTITWNAANVPVFRSLTAGESGTVRFFVSTKNAYPIRRLSDKNFKLRVEAAMESPTVPPTVAAIKTVSIADNEVKVKGRTDIQARALFRDAASGMLNSGPFPPRVNVPTNFTVHWALVNYSSDAESVVVRAYLQAGVRFTGMVKSTIPSVPVYNERTQEMTWQIDRISAAKGVVNDPIEAVFQIEATPSVANVGQFMPLVSQAELKAKDAFTGLDLVGTSEALTTFLLYDSTVNPNQGIVVQ